MFRFLLLIFLFLSSIPLHAQINTDNINIVRDEWGVPHIFTQTDAEAAYGLAWAHAEDNFEQIQEPFLVAKGLLGSVKGQTGALFDAVSFLIKTKEITEEKYETTFSPEFKKILEAYAAGLNRFAEVHPKEILHKELFPVSPKEIVQGYMLSISFISNVQFDLGRLFQNQLMPITFNEVLNSHRGSNGIAIAPHKTKEGKTFLLSNSHQPLRNYMSWYEVHIHSEEGWQFLGATFAGGVTPFVGTNANLGWTHCVNYNDGHDVYELTMHPKKKLHYKFDGEWLPLEERIWKGKVKLGFLKIGVKRKFYWSKHGPVIKNKSGFYALRFPANMVIGAPEQWYHMNKAQTFEEFKTALALQQQPSLSTTYADKKGNIYFLDNGLFPYRNPDYNWHFMVPGDTSATLWEPKFMPLDKVLQVENPPSGYVFHMNGTGFNCTADADNPNPKDYNPTMGYAQSNVSRHLRFKSLINNYDKLSYDDFKNIKYDQKHNFPLYTRTLQNWDILRNLSPEQHPDLKDIIEVFSKWDGSGDIHNKQAAIFILTSYNIGQYNDKHGIADREGKLPTKVYSNAMRYAKKYLLKHFGSLEIELGSMQKHIRGDKILPVGGLPETIAAMYTIPHKKGTRQTNLGDSYILFATYGEDGVEKIETINCYGSSNRPESPHYNDQMDLYVQQKTKTMTLDKATILSKAKKNYHPK